MVSERLVLFVGLVFTVTSVSVMLMTVVAFSQM